VRCIDRTDDVSEIDARCVNVGIARQKRAFFRSKIDVGDIDRESIVARFESILPTIDAAASIWSELESTLDERCIDRGNDVVTSDARCIKRDIAVSSRASF
jgi:hypothetical protein